MIKRLILIPFLLLLAAPLLKGQEAPYAFLNDTTTYLWPTNASTLLSSTFAETRSAHLHSGIDIRTWGREGYLVFASRDGIVHRIGISPEGYGNVIYLKHHDDSYTVYAHLNRFEDELQQIVDSLRFIDYTYEMNMIFEEFNFHYSKGDTIGYSGSTGVGPPHLHFEIRNPEYIPVNPLLSNLTIRDNIPPVFTGLAIEHLDPETLHYTRHEKVHPKHSHTDTVNFGQITINNPAGLAVDLYDGANNTPNVYAVYELILTSESDTLFHSKADHFPFGTDQMMFLDRSYHILAETRRGYQRLYVVNGNKLPFYKKLTDRGVIHAKQGEKDLLITARDIYGNTSYASVQVNFESDHKFERIESVPAYPSVHKDIMGNLLPLFSRKFIPPVGLSDISKSPGNSFESGQNMVHRRQSSDTVISTVYPNRRNLIHSADNRAWITIPQPAIYDTLTLSMTISQDDEVPVIRFNPNRLPIQNSISFGMLLPEQIADKKHIGLYSYDEYRDRLFFMNSTIENGIIRADLKEFAELRVLHDPHPPFVGIPRIEKNLAGNYIVILPTVDKMSGIDYRNSEIIVNGERGIIEYDPEKDFLFYYNPSFEPRIENFVEFTVKNGVGNSVSRSVTISN